MGKTRIPRRSVVRQIQLGALAVLLLCGCATGQHSPQQFTPLSQLSAEVRDAWHSNHEILVNIARGKRFDTRTYAAAVEFFERVTQLQAHDDWCDFGRIPTGNLESDIGAWDSWLTAHASCLRWNASQSVVECVQ
jgi:hypothetical protein